MKEESVKVSKQDVEEGEEELEEDGDDDAADLRCGGHGGNKGDKHGWKEEVNVMDMEKRKG